MNNLETMMKKDGWKRKERYNSGRVYIEWHKNGFIISDEDISEEEKL